MGHLEPQLKTLAEDYLAWLKDRIKIEAIPGSGAEWLAITTPLLDRHNDFIQIYARALGGGIQLSDDGYTLEELERSGCSITTPKRKSIFHNSLQSFGIVEDDGVLTATVGKKDYPFKVHLFVQGILTISDMFFLASPTVASLFREDVEAWMDEQGVRFLPTVKITGKSGYDHIFDFAIPKSTSSPERLLRVLSKPNRERAESLAFAWVDTREVRRPETAAYAILNDSEEPISEPVIGALKAYSVIPVPWSDREGYRDKLAA